MYCHSLLTVPHFHPALGNSSQHGSQRDTPLLCSEPHPQWGQLSPRVAQKALYNLPHHLSDPLSSSPFLTPSIPATLVSWGTLNSLGLRTCHSLCVKTPFSQMKVQFAASSPSRCHSNVTFTVRTSREYLTRSQSISTLKLWNLLSCFIFLKNTYHFLIYVLIYLFTSVLFLTLEHELHRTGMSASFWSLLYAHP